MEVVLPISEISILDYPIHNVIVSVELKVGGIVGNRRRWTGVFPSQKSVVNLSESLVAASTRCTVLFC